MMQLPADHLLKLEVQVMLHRESALTVRSHTHVILGLQLHTTTGVVSVVVRTNP
jgi:hypothetical protein